jgi:hypothetical protein
MLTCTGLERGNNLRFATRSGRRHRNDWLSPLRECRSAQDCQQLSQLPVRCIQTIFRINVGKYIFSHEGVSHTVWGEERTVHLSANTTEYAVADGICANLICVINALHLHQKKKFPHIFAHAHQRL